MVYNLELEYDRQRYLARVKHLLDIKGVVELTEKRQRTLTQNSYLHVILGAFAMETGNTLEYVKDAYFKRFVNRDIFITSKVDFLTRGQLETVRSSRDLSKEEMTTAITRFRNWAADNGIYLPSPEDEKRIRDIEIDMERHKNYL